MAREPSLVRDALVSGRITRDTHASCAALARRGTQNLQIARARADIVAGTPTYFAPEVAAQFANVDNRPAIGVKADVFSLALTLRNALDPANEESIGESVEVFIARRAICAPPPPRSPDLNYLAPHFARWLELDPSKRPDAETFANQLDVLLEPETRRERRRAQRAAIIPLTVVALSVLLVVGFFFGVELLVEGLFVEFFLVVYRRLRLPMVPGNRSLNLSNAVAVVVFEAWRQQGYAGGQ